LCKSRSYKFELASKRKVVPYLSFYQIANIGKFWSTRKVVFIIYKFGSFWKNKKSGLMGWAHE
jgi:hypothetical protein